VPNATYGTTPVGSARPWPTAKSSDNLDYSLDVTKPLTDVTDTIIAVSLSASPSGAGELQCATLTVPGNPRMVGLRRRPRPKLHRPGCREATAGRSFVWTPGLSIVRSGASLPLPPAPNPSFGTPIKGQQPSRAWARRLPTIMPAADRLSPVSAVQVVSLVPPCLGSRSLGTRARGSVDNPSN
jgi:hypothetical protein